MNFSLAFLARGASWTVGAFVAGQGVRFAANVALTRMLSPEIFGLMMVINSIRTGIELTLDAGIGQNIVRNPSGEDPVFYNTAWTLQILRGIFLTVVGIAAALPLAHLFELPILSVVLPVASLQFLISGLNSVSRFLVRRRVQFVRSNLFELAVQFGGTAILLSVVYVSPDVWGVIWGGLGSVALMAAGSYLLVPGMTYSLKLNRAYLARIVSFGKWIYLSSIIYFLSMHFDRLYLAKLIPLEQLGVYGLARAMADIVNGLSGRLGDMIVFPLIASAQSMDRSDLRGNVQRKRLLLLSIAAACLAIAAAVVDIPFRLIFDERYHAAGEMVSIFLLGSWFTVLCVTAEASLLGLGRPVYSTGANALKFCYLIVAIPLTVPFGVLAIVAAVAVGDVVKFSLIAMGSVRERFSFLAHDALLTAAMIGLFVLLQILRSGAGLGTSISIFSTILP